MKLLISCLFVLCTFFCIQSFATPATAPTPAATAPAAKPVAPLTNDAPPGSLLRIIVSLVVVVGLLIALSVAFKKFGMDRIQGNLPIKIIGGVNIGTNQRIMVIEAGEEWVVVGVTPQNITPLTTMMRVENAGTTDSTNKPNFAGWMQSSLEKYRAKNS